jgi:hypothetical protein
MTAGGTVVVSDTVAATEVSVTLGSEWDGIDLYWSVQPCAPCSPFYSPGPWAPARLVRVQPAVVHLYDEVGLAGATITVTAPGRYSLLDTFDDRIMSIEMPEGCSARLFKDDPDGPHACVPGSDEDLSDDQYSDGTPAAASASWIDVFVQPECPPVLQQHVYLPATVRDYGPVPVCTDIIVNGGFEVDSAWIRINGAEYTGGQAHSGSRSMLVTGAPGLYASASQVIGLPAGQTATLRYWVRPTCTGCDVQDKQYVWLWDEAQTVHYLSPASRDDTQIWAQREHDLSAFAGQTVRLFFSAYRDGDGETNLLHVDDVTLCVE